MHTNPVPGAQRRQLRQRDQHARPEPRAGQHRPRQRDRRVPLHRPVPARCASRVCSRPTGIPVQVQPDPALGAGHDRRHQRQGHRRPGSRVDDQQGSTTRTPATGHNTYDDTGSVTTFTMPHDGQLWQDTQTVFTDDDWNQIKPINQGDYDTVPTVIPAHLGGSSPIKHVVVIVKENRTYDQVLGDLRAKATATRPTPSSARRSRRTSTRWPRGSAIWTTSTTRARCRPTATTGSSRPRPTTTSRRSSGRSTGPIRPRAATRSPTSVTASSGTRPRRPG